MGDLADLLDYCRADGRVCLGAQLWNQFWEQLPNRRRNENGQWEPPLPLILGAWRYTSNVEKAGRLACHVRWAAEHGALATADRFLRAVPDHEWHYCSELELPKTLRHPL